MNNDEYHKWLESHDRHNQRVKYIVWSSKLSAEKKVINKHAASIKHQKNTVLFRDIFKIFLKSHHSQDLKVAEIKLFSLIAANNFAIEFIN